MGSGDLFYAIVAQEQDEASLVRNLIVDRQETDGARTRRSRLEALEGEAGVPSDGLGEVSQGIPLRGAQRGVLGQHEVPIVVESSAAKSACCDAEQSTQHCQHCRTQSSRGLGKRPQTNLYKHYML